MATTTDISLTASELRAVLGQLMRRLRAEHRFPLMHGAVLGRLDREGPRSIGDLAASERVRPQSMAQTVAEMEDGGLVARSPDPADGRRVIMSITTAGRRVLNNRRNARVEQLARALSADFSAAEREQLLAAAPLLERLAHSI